MSQATKSKLAKLTGSQVETLIALAAATKNQEWAETAFVKTNFSTDLSLSVDALGKRLLRLYEGGYVLFNTRTRTYNAPYSWRLSAKGKKQVQ